MKNILWTLLVLIFFSVSVFAQTESRKIDWERFSSNIEIAFKSRNTGLKQSAMQMIVKYKDHLDVSWAAEKVVKEFTSNPNPELRKQALVTLYKIKDDRAINLLKEQNLKERNRQLKNTINMIVEACEKNNLQEADKIVNDVYLSLGF